MNPGKKKVAILGGGAGALAAAFELSALPNWQERFEITVYQLGWRLGGKGASGRNRSQFNRIEEHGIHLWLGYYENAFRTMRKCYAENGRPLSAPLARWEEAFKPHNIHVMEERTPHGTAFWPVRFAPAAGNPGDGGVPSHWQALCLAVNGMLAMFQSAAGSPRSGSDPRLLPGIEHFLCDLAEAMLLEAGEAELRAIAHIIRDAGGDEGLRERGRRQSLVGRLDAFWQWLWKLLERHVAENTEAMRLWLLMDFGLANLRGYLADGVVEKGFGSLDDIDYRAWLRKHGASEITLRSQAVNWAYNFLLHDRSELSTGVMLNAMSRALLTCKGAVYWKLQAGMGDVVFAPMYEVLRKRGVQFRFFHRVKNLGLSADGERVGTIQLGRQATVKEGDYEPLFDVRGLPCWPSEPLYEQLVEGEALKAGKINLESFWTTWQDVEEVKLRDGVDFDAVVLGISVAGLPAICGELIASRPAWKDMVERLATTATQSFQVWTHPDAAGLGFPVWRQPVALILTAAEPINSWADMSDILEREEWPGHLAPNHVGYLCGVTEAGVPPASDYGFPAEQQKELKRVVTDYLNEQTGGFWPAAHGESGFDWRLLAGATEAEGEARLDSQYLRVNIDPAERYVLSAPGTARYRIDPGKTGVANLFLAGDWVDTPMNAGCVEAAVMGGMAAAQALAGEAIPIEGEAFAHPERAAADKKG